MTEIKRDVAKRLRIAIENSGLTYKDLEDRTGIPLSTIQRYATAGAKRFPVERLTKLADTLEVTPAWLLGLLPDPSDVSPNNIVDIPSGKRIPLYAAIGAGAAKIADDYIEGYIDVDGKADFAVKVEGDSMAPTILNGDIILVRQACDVEDNAIAVILKDDSAVCKRIHHIPHAIVCISDNEAYDPFILKDAKILGKVVGLHREF